MPTGQMIDAVDRSFTIPRHPDRRDYRRRAGRPAAQWLPNDHHPDVMRAILAGIIETCDALGAAGPGRTVLAVTVDSRPLDELAAFGSDLDDREPESRRG